MKVGTLYSSNALFFKDFQGIFMVKIPNLQVKHKENDY